MRTCRRRPFSSSPVCRPFLAVLAASLLGPSLAFAIEPPSPDLKAISSPQFSSEELEVVPTLVEYEQGSAGLKAISGLQRFLDRNSDEWEVRWDRRGDRPNVVQGSGVALLPGKGNSLVLADLGLGHAGVLQMADVESRVRGFMAEFPELLRVAPGDLRLDAKSSVNVGRDKEVWLLEFQQVKKGIPVEGASVYFRINHGNIVQFGAEKVGDVRIATTPRLSREQALRAALAAAGFASRQIRVVQPGELKIFPTLGLGEVPGDRYQSTPGYGYRHVLAWELSFARAGDPASYQAVVEARSGKVLRVVDLNRYVAAQVSGGIYPRTNTDTEEVRGLPSASVSNGSTQVTDASGNYDYTGGTASATLNGRYIRISDNCGAISLSDAATGNLAFGAGAGTDCVTPGVGGAGNTHAARTGFYHLTNINRKAAGFLAGNAWLNGTLTANMNINQTCNAFWSPSAGTVNFYRSGGGCSNTGEIAAVFLHEWGHGMDTNSGGAAPDQGTGEALGDTFAFLETRDSCIGPNFRPGVPCFNCGTCTGVRDVAVFASGGARTIAKPSTVTDNNGINCDRFQCPYKNFGQPYQGPLGFEGHCESYIASSANWDLAQMLVAHYGVDPGWAAMDAIWYDSLTPSKSAYQLVSGRKCTTTATVDGCGATNWYTVYLAVDDDDGNLANGTPNGCRIWDAFNLHGIACGSRPACTL
jgi:trimeric autotransporter adhesin